MHLLQPFKGISNISSVLVNQAWDWQPEVLTLYLIGKIWLVSIYESVLSMYQYPILYILNGKVRLVSLDIS